MLHDACWGRHRCCGAGLSSLLVGSLRAPGRWLLHNRNSLCWCAARTAAPEALASAQPASPAEQCTAAACVEIQQPAAGSSMAASGGGGEEGAARFVRRMPPGRAKPGRPGATPAAGGPSKRPECAAAPPACAHSCGKQPSAAATGAEGAVAGAPAAAHPLAAQPCRAILPPLHVCPTRLHAQCATLLALGSAGGEGQGDGQISSNDCDHL